MASRKVFLLTVLIIGTTCVRLVHSDPIPNTNPITTKDVSDADLHELAMHPDDDLLSISTRSQSPQEKTTSFWMDDGLDFVQQQLHKRTNSKRAKNVIMFLGDGMSAVTIAATRPYIGSEGSFLSWERFPAVGAAKTYCVDGQVADSACTATAYLCGVKANLQTLGVTANVTRLDCTAQLEKSNQIASIAQWAVDAGKVVGLVTTSGVTAASPAGLYAHSSYRYWENDVKVGKMCDPSVTPDIAKQLMDSELGAQFRVIMGGHREDFRPNSTIDEEGHAGGRGDGRDLIAEWLKRNADKKAAYVWNATEMRSLDLKHVDYLLGLFEAGDLQYNKEVQMAKSQDTEPSLHEMTRAAIEVLGKHDEGFFLFVEGDNIDSAHHQNYAQLSLDETAELSKAVEVARGMLPDDDTLFVVTSDHSHPMTYSGYPYRGNDITGAAGSTNSDGMKYMTLSYANGPGFTNQMGSKGRVNVDSLNTKASQFRSPAMVPLAGDTHAGEDVMVYAAGPWSHLFNGNYEQHVIPNLMAYAACLNGLGPDSCRA